MFFDLKVGNRIYIQTADKSYAAEYQGLSDNPNFPNWIQIFVEGKSSLLNPDNILIITKL